MKRLWPRILIIKSLSALAGIGLLYVAFIYHEHLYPQGDPLMRMAVGILAFWGFVILHGAMHEP